MPCDYAECADQVQTCAAGQVSAESGGAGAAVFHFAVCDGCSSPTEKLRAGSVRCARAAPDGKSRPHSRDDEWCGRRRMGGGESEREKSSVEFSVRSTSMGAASDWPPGPQDPYAPKRLRDPEQSRPLAERRSSRPSRVEADDLSESDPQIQWLRVRPAGVQSLIEPPTLPPPKLRRSFMAQFALLAGASILSALAIVVFYRFVNHAATPAAAPQLASSSTRSVRTVTVTPPAAPGPFDEGSGNAAPPTATAVVPVPAPGPPPAAGPTSVAAAVP